MIWPAWLNLTNALLKENLPALRPEQRQSNKPQPLPKSMPTPNDNTNENERTEALFKTETPHEAQRILQQDAADFVAKFNELSGWRETRDQTLRERDSVTTTDNPGTREWLAEFNRLRGASDPEPESKQQQLKESMPLFDSIEQAEKWIKKARGE